MVNLYHAISAISGRNIPTGCWDREPIDVEAERMLRCPNCYSADRIYTSRYRGWEFILGLLIQRPYRCLWCHTRFFRFWRFGKAPVPVAADFSGYLTPIGVDAAKSSNPPVGNEMLGKTQGQLEQAPGASHHKETLVDHPPLGVEGLRGSGQTIPEIVVDPAAGAGKPKPIVEQHL